MSEEDQLPYGRIFGELMSVDKAVLCDVTSVLSFPYKDTLEISPKKFRISHVLGMADGYVICDIVIMYMPRWTSMNLIQPHAMRFYDNCCDIKDNVQIASQA